MHVHKHQLYLLKQNSESLKIWSAMIQFNTEGKSLIIKLGSGVSPLVCCCIQLQPIS